MLASLGTLISGVKAETLRVLPTDTLLTALPNITLQRSRLSPAQHTAITTKLWMFFGLDILLNNTLTGLQRRFIAQSILKTYHNLTAPDFRRLGNLTCLANTADLLVYKQTPALDAIKLNIQDCVRLGSVVPSEMVSSLLVERAVLAEPTSLSPEQLYHLAVIMPSLGIPFINQLLPSQVQAALPALSSVDFSPAQQVLPEMLASLGTLISGVKAETLRVLPTDTLLTALPNITLQRSRLSPAQHTAITTKLWGSNQVTGWLGALDPLLPETPLLSVRSRLTPLLSNLSTVSHRAWNTQQSVHAFLMLVECNALMPLDVLHRSLGMISQGVDCETLKRRFLSSSSSVISRILLFLHGLPAQLHSSLKKCITNESYNFSFSAGLLEEMGAQVAVELPLLHPDIVFNLLHPDIVFSLLHPDIVFVIAFNLLHPDIVFSLLHPDIVFSLLHPDIVFSLLHPDIVFNLLHLDIVFSLLHPDIVFSLLHPDIVFNLLHPDIVFVIVFNLLHPDMFVSECSVVLKADLFVSERSVLLKADLFVSERSVLLKAEG
ncbi:Stereocilin [Acipenser ruthenus]|uniref:Stereocilin n=1 Tax=Acipenser ruthenus TaxID=7906 RepID=A0A444UZJ0_ACIRT|nr:Stereocilin [Acipenser ruthenus]